ncbi:TetR/AcrR family transcriptional regulator [Streptomyces thermolilacinus]|uniref:TetR/AcrR family transcriptional regulator n=1 Tax=Streptomyces thermolilacinus TaxID=285540 RepID=UPI000688AAD8|nr:TetR/AcrR family transcriptional regulator [Streptomyces thermolilacinus]
MLDAAVRVFGRRGYRAASMEEIAELAGVSKPLVYLYLHSKEDLFTACLRREAAALMAAVRAGAGGPGKGGVPVDEGLWAALMAFFTHTTGNPDGWALLHRQARTHGEPFAAEAATLRTELTDHVTSLITRASTGPLTPREATALSHALVGAAESLADWANSTPAATPEEAARTLLHLTRPALSSPRTRRR